MQNSPLSISPQNSLNISESSSIFECDLNKIKMQRLEHFHTLFHTLHTVLNTHAPIKTKMIRFNNNVFMTRELRKEIMKRSKLRNKFNRNRNHENWCNFKIQRRKK